ncbi:MAG: outer membrane beta-barrel protein [Dysgonamonadaceae bacterium]|nr:outer membrane beta-barrel protein [Dysgonamonadaceae bacterium]
MQNIAFWLSVFLFLISGIVPVFAQHTFTGKVTDMYRQSLPDAQVMLFTTDSLYAGSLTDNGGNFSFRDLQSGEYLLNIICFGYTPLEDSIQITDNILKHNYMLAKDTVMNLDTVVVTADLSNTVKRTATGQKFYLSEQAKNSGDPYIALKEIPRLNINESLRSITMEDGASPLILINGIAVNSGVAPIDPKEIVSVEIMDAVSARYLRTGARHIINIRLKEKKNPYTFFEVMSRHDIPLRQGMGAVYFEIGNSKYSLYGRGTGGYIYNDKTETEGWQRSSNYFKQNSGTERADSYNFLGELLFKCMLTEKDFLAAHLYFRHDKRKTENSGSGAYRTDDTQDFSYTSLNRDSSNIWTGSLYHRHIFSETELLETTLAFNGNQNRNEGERLETYLDRLYQNFYEYRNRRSSGSLNIDYSLEWNEINSLNIGSETKYINDGIHRVSSGFPVFNHHEWSQYLYTAFSSKIKNLYYMGSLGFESIWLKAGDVSGNHIRPRASVSGTFMFNDNSSIQAVYTLTDESPEVGTLNPYNTSTDSLVITRGNPGLFPMRQHKINLSYTFNKSGFYISPSAYYGIDADAIEPFGYTENGIYISSYRNTGKFRSLAAGSSAGYRMGKWGNINVSGYHCVDYFSEQEARESFSFSAGITAKYKKWYFGIDFNYRNYSYTAISRTEYRTPDYSLAQIKYSFTPNFYISAALQYLTGAIRQNTETYSKDYRSFTSQQMVDRNVRPWILIRYTFRKNDSRKIKLNNSIVDSKEKGISL